MQLTAQIEQEPNYQKKAEIFAEATSLNFDASLIGVDYYFDGDKEKRAIYQITLHATRKGEKGNFRFGQSINNTKNKKRPSLYDVLACLTKYNPGTFNNFCLEYGYDTDSMKAFDTYQAVCKEWEMVCILFTVDEIEALTEIY